MVISYLQEYLAYTVIVVFTVWFLVRCASSTRGRKLPPGPPGWPIIGNLLVLFQDPEYPNGENYFMRRAREYGEIYKLELGSQLLYVLSNPNHIREVLTHKKIKGRPLGIGFKKAFGPEAHGFAFATGPEWESVRKFTKILFRDLGVGKGVFEERIDAEIERFIRTIGSDEKPCSDLFGLLPLAIANIVCGITFGHQYEYDDEELIAGFRLNQAFANAVGPSAAVLTSSVLCAVPYGPGRKLMESLTDFQEFMKSIIRKTRASSIEGEAPNSFVRAFLPKMENGDAHFDEPNMITCCLELFFAGTQSVAAAITWVVFFLVTHPDVQRRCQQELDDVAKELPAEIPCYADRSKLPYLRATLQESDRLSTLGPLGLPHVVDEDLRLFGYDFPKGTSVVGNFRAIYMNEEKYPKPRDFDPERFLENGQFKADGDIIPFSMGRRVCPGESLSRMSIFLFVVSLLHEFTITVPEDVQMPDVTQGRSAGVARLPPPFTIVFKKRQTSIYISRRGTIYCDGDILTYVRPRRRPVVKAL